MQTNILNPDVTLKACTTLEKEKQRHTGTAARAIWWRVSLLQWRL